MIEQLKEEKTIKENNYAIMKLFYGNNERYLIKKIILNNINYINMLKNDVAALIKLKNIKNVSKLVSYQFDSKPYFVVYDYIDGINLSKVVFTTIQEKILCMIKILNVVEQIHNLGIIHCDLKPSNIMITKNGDVIIIDFGISCSMQENLFLGYGSYKYCSLEQLAGKKVDYRTDIYSLGIIFYQLINQILPFDDIVKEKVILQKKQGIFKLSDNEQINIIYKKTINNNINRRYLSINDFKQDLLNLLNSFKEK